MNNAPETATEEKKEIPVTRVHAHKEGYVDEETHKKIKEQEEAAALKKAQFDKDPDMFVHIDDIVVAAIKSERGIGVMLGRCQRIEMELSLTRLTYRVYGLFQQMDVSAMIAAKQKESGIITAPEHGKIIT